MQVRALFLAMSLIATPALAEELPVIVKIPRLTMEAASKIAQGAVEACRKKGIQITATVVDRSGNPMAVLRDTMAPPVSVKISREKAYTAVNFNAPLSTMEDRFTKPFSVGKVEGLLFSAGGIPISAAGNIVGAVGVSGASTGEQDEACAKAGVDGILMELEMAGT